MESPFTGGWGSGARKTQKPMEAVCEAEWWSGGAGLIEVGLGGDGSCSGDSWRDTVQNIPMML